MPAPTVKYVLASVGSLSLYMFFSISLTFYQKSLLKVLPFPLTIVLSHLVLKYLLAALLRNYLECTYDNKRTTLNWQLYWRRLAAPGVCSALDIGLSQCSLEFITITMYTMVKSTSVVFIYVCALLFGLERMQYSMLTVVLLISGGLSLFTYESTEFSVLGFMMALIASGTSGVRWTLSQLVMQRQEMGLANPIDMIYHIQPWMIISILPFAILFEGVDIACSADFVLFLDRDHLNLVLGKVLLGCLLAFLMDCAEFLSLRITSSVTLCVTGVFKEVCTLLLAIFANGDQLNALNAIGLLVCVTGICGHAIVKIQHLRRMPAGGATSQRDLQQQLPLLDGDNGDIPSADGHRRHHIHHHHDDDDDDGDEDVLFQTG